MEDNIADDKSKLTQLNGKLEELQATKKKLQLSIFSREKLADYAEGIIGEYQYIEKRKSRYEEIYKADRNEIKEKYGRRIQKIHLQIQKIENQERELINEEKKQIEFKRKTKHNANVKRYKSHEKKLNREVRSAIRRKKYYNAQKKLRSLKEYREQYSILYLDSDIKNTREAKKECRRKIKELESQIMQWDKWEKEEIIVEYENKEKAIAEIRKPNVVRRALGFLFNKIGLKRVKDFFLGVKKDKTQGGSQQDISQIEETTLPDKSKEEKKESFKASLKEKIENSLDEDKQLQSKDAETTHTVAVQEQER